MKNANGMGSVYKLSGKRRKPWIARKTKEWHIDVSTGKVAQTYIIIGYFATKQEALTALINYNENPYDLDIHNMTFADVYEKWSEKHFESVSASAIRMYKSAFNYCEPIHDMHMRDIHTNHLEGTINNAPIGSRTKRCIKSLYNQLYRYALKYDIVDKNYARLYDNVEREDPKIKRTVFSDAEIKTLWDNIDFPFADMILIGIYNGWRPQELAILKIADVDLQNRSFCGGLKTNAGRNRIVPIHPIIYNLVEKNHKKALSLHSEYLFNDENDISETMLTYFKYRARFKKVCSQFGMTHKPHDTRHTFITKAKAVNMNEYVLKLIVGHSIKDVTEKTYTHRTIQQLYDEICKIK